MVEEILDKVMHGRTSVLFHESLVSPIPAQSIPVQELCRSFNECQPDSYQGQQYVVEQK